MSMVLIIVEKFDKSFINLPSALLGIHHVELFVVCCKHLPLIHSFTLWPNTGERGK